MRRSLAVVLSSASLAACAGGPSESPEAVQRRLADCRSFNLQQVSEAMARQESHAYQLGLNGVQPQRLARSPVVQIDCATGERFMTTRY